MRMVSLALLTGLLAAPALAQTMPETVIKNVVDSYHGVDVDDPYRWLEQDSADPVVAWNRTQDAYARAYLDKLTAREQIAARITSVLGDNTVSYFSAQRLKNSAWFMKYAPPRQQSVLVRLSAEGDPATEQLVFDPEQFDSSGATSIEWYRVSPDSKLVAIALTEAGTEVADLHIFNVANGAAVDRVVPRVNAATAGGDMRWDRDSTGFFYTRYPRDGERPADQQSFYQQVWHRQLGTPLADDRYEIGKDFPRVAAIRFEQHHPSGKVLLTLQYGDSGRFQLYLRDSKQNWHQVSSYDDKWVQATFADANTLIVISRDAAPRGKLLAVDVSQLPKVSSKTLVPQSDISLASNFYGDPTVLVHQARIYVKALLGGPQDLRVFDLAGKPQAVPPMQVAGVGQLVPWGERLLFRQYSYLEPNTWKLFDGKQSVKHPLSSTSSVEFSGYDVVRELALSKDGTEVPVNVMLPKGASLDGSRPLLLTGYGGYGISLSPGFSASRIAWLEQGGLIAIANLRGGGEFGEDWHQQGMLTRKQNVFDDFHGVMQHLVARKYTSVDKLAIEGGSNGGLLMGAMLTQHPADFAAVVSHVGIYDAVRSELSANGEFNIPEFGTVAKADEFSALYAYSPYHNAKMAAYPPVLFMTGENDGRVEPMHSRKMTAMLQAKDTSKASPVLLRSSGNTGHGSGTPLDEVIAQQVDRLSFLFSALSMDYRPRVPARTE